MGRPKKQSAERRDQRRNLRFTVAEMVHIETQAGAAGLDVHEYLRRRCLGYVVPSGERSPRIDPALVSETNRLGTAVSALGNVVNQVALYLHTDRSIPGDWEVLPAKIRETQEKIADVLDQMVGAMLG